jgi:hypothetical protein
MDTGALSIGGGVRMDTGAPSSFGGGVRVDTGADVASSAPVDSGALSVTSGALAAVSVVDTGAFDAAAGFLFDLVFLLDLVTV